jgi:hypothetical protein
MTVRKGALPYYRLAVIVVVGNPTLRIITNRRHRVEEGSYSVENSRPSKNTKKCRAQLTHAICALLHRVYLPEQVLLNRSSSSSTVHEADS